MADFVTTLNSEDAGPSVNGFGSSETGVPPAASFHPSDNNSISIFQKPIVQQDTMTMSTSSTTSTLSCSSAVSSAPLLSYMAFKTVGRGSFGNVYLAKVVKKSPPGSSSNLPTPQSSVHSQSRSNAQSFHGQSHHGQSHHGQSVHSYSSVNTAPSVASLGSMSVASPYGKISRVEDEVNDRLRLLSLGASIDTQDSQQQLPFVVEPQVPEEEEYVAIKKVYQNKKFKNRELEIMRQLHKQPHPYIVHMMHYFTTKGKRADDVYLNLVLDYVPETLASVIHLRKLKKELLPSLLVKVYVYQMLRGLAHLHGLGITHRDIKPHNLLVDPLRHTLKICDLGSAKCNVQSEANVAYICSRFYRAPELVLGCTHYSSAIDIWSAGCVLAEMLLGGPFFPGTSSAEQMMEIARMMGTPTRDELLAMSPPTKTPAESNVPTKQTDFFNHMTMPSMKPRELSKVFPFAPLGAISLLERLLKYSPCQRPTAIDACGHYHLDELRNPKTVLPVATADDYSPPAKEDSSSAAKITNDMIAHSVAIATSLGPRSIPQEMFDFTEEEMTLASAPTILKLTGENARGRLIPSKVKGKRDKDTKEKEKDPSLDAISGKIASAPASKDGSMHSSRSVSSAGTTVASTSTSGASVKIAEK